jgi:hypothetical protein
VGGLARGIPRFVGHGIVWCIRCCWRPSGAGAGALARVLACEGARLVLVPVDGALLDATADRHELELLDKLLRIFGGGGGG